jgi:two-component system OmpR family sensor kinase
LLSRLSLRARLILGVVVLAAAGLLVADVATYTSLRSFLISRTDSSLAAAHQSVEAALHRPGRGPHPDEHDSPPGDGSSPLSVDKGQLTAAAPGDWVEVRKLDGTVVAKGCAPQFSAAGSLECPRPKLAASITPTGSAGGERVSYLTTSATTGGSRYRVRASIDPSSSQYVLIVAQSLSGVDSTLNRLLLIEGLVTLVVLAGIALLGLWVIRLGLRPLTAIGATAATIAAGDLTQRVQREDERTEVGRLGLALNAMLGQIESAFRAREASERKLRRFVADASHELRTPLAAVRAYAELFTRGAANRPADLERSMRGITRESERMSVLVDDLLLLARLDEGRPLERDPVDLRAVVAEAVETARTVEPSRQITSRLDDANVTGDRDRLRQIVDNLLANVRAHAGDDATVAVSLSRVDGVARISVHDSGPGIGQEQLAHVFERFYRADASRARTSGGVGLGLSIVSAVTDAHHGHVSASSAPGEGATFVIELPLAQG